MTYVRITGGGHWQDRYLLMPEGPKVGDLVVAKGYNGESKCIKVESREWVQEEMTDEDGLQWVLQINPVFRRKLR
jgi:thiamine monophosphate kinase